MAKKAMKPELPRFVTLQEALNTFAGCLHGTEGQKHIRPLHWYVSCRLVIEGGFSPDLIIPRPPLVVQRSRRGLVLVHDPSTSVAGEHTMFGGLKTKAVDVVVSIPRIGPVIALSMKGTLKAFRNLTNRMEEAAGDCTNIHLAYPGLVYAFWHIFRANMAGVAPVDTPTLIELTKGRFKPADVALRADGGLSSYLARYFFAMERLSGRRDLRDDPSAYEAVGMTLVDVAAGRCGQALSTHPPADTPIHYHAMFETIYREYDLRFVYQSPKLKALTKRLIWSEESPAIQESRQLDYTPRIGEPEPDEDEEEATEMEREVEESS